jgi:hypothetical protein
VDDILEEFRKWHNKAMDSAPVSDFYSPDGKLKSYEERNPIFKIESKEEDSEETKKTKSLLEDFLNKSWSQEDDDRIQKKIINALLFGTSENMYD